MSTNQLKSIVAFWWWLFDPKSEKRKTKRNKKKDMEVQQRKKYPNWAEEQRRKAAELARVRAIREKKMDRNKKEVGRSIGRTSRKVLGGSVFSDVS